MGKKVISCILTIITLSVLFMTPVCAASDMKLSEEVYPISIVEGNPFSIYGIITSSHNIMTVVVGVYNTDGTEEFSYTGKPGRTTYDIHNIDYLMTFSKLRTGNYIYKIVASDTVQSNVTLLSKSFKVTSTAQTSSITLSGENYPQSYVQGNTFSVYGTVSSPNTLTSVTCEVRSSSGAVQFTKTANPNSTSYSVHSLDAYMTFSKLTAGTYRYIITASDSESSGVVLLDKSFTVTQPIVSTFEVANAVYPNRIVQGKTFSVYGTVTSDYKISSLTAGVYTTGGTAKFSKTVSPSSTSYSINQIDSYMTFASLSAGTYYYRITATDSQVSNYVVLEKKFAVVQQTGAEAKLSEDKTNYVDLSVWNTISSWSKLGSAVDGAILRIGFRGTVNRVIAADTEFLNLYKKAKEQNLHVGCYFFSNALNTAEAVEEAEYVHSVLSKNNCKLDMPVYFDMETPAQVALTRDECTDIAKAFCDKMKELGYYPGVYCSTSFAQSELNRDKLSEYTFWIAHYASCCTFTGSYGMWQYSETGSVSGISGNVDSNYCYYDYPKYITANGMNGYSVEKPEVNIISSSGAVLNSADNTISKIEPNLSASSFTSKYLSMSSGVTVDFANTVGGLVATGTTITVKSGTTIIATYKISVLGDLNSDGKINSADALTILKQSVGMISLSKFEKLSADYTGDGTINSADALAVLKYAVGVR